MYYGVAHPGEWHTEYKSGPFRIYHKWTAEGRRLDAGKRLDEG